MLNNLSLYSGLWLCAALFAIGFTGIIVRRNLLFMLMSLEIMLNACALAFVMAGNYWQQADGQVFFILILTLAAAEAAIGLALVMQFYRRHHSLDIDLASEMRG